MINPAVYILAGTNGVGKSTAAFQVIPIGVPFINADIIAAKLRKEYPDRNIQEIANAEAIKLMNSFINVRETFAFETNLADGDTWKFLLSIQHLGYKLNLYFFGVDNIETCIHRIENRVKEGGHFVRSDVARHRYENGIKLLNYYKTYPDNLYLVDCLNNPIIKAHIQKGKIYEIENDFLPKWIENLLQEIIAEENNSSQNISIEEIKRRYKQGEL